jgi:hypothetical protein
VIDYCRTGMAFADKEQFRLLHPWSALFIYFKAFYVASLERPLDVPQVLFFVRFATRNCATRDV